MGEAGVGNPVIYVVLGEGPSGALGRDPGETVAWGLGCDMSLQSSVHSVMLTRDPLGKGPLDSMDGRGRGERSWLLAWVPAVGTGRCPGRLASGQVRGPALGDERERRKLMRHWAGVWAEEDCICSVVKGHILRVI